MNPWACHAVNHGLAVVTAIQDRQEPPVAKLNFQDLTPWDQVLKV